LVTAQKHVMLNFIKTLRVLQQKY